MSLILDDTKEDLYGRMTELEKKLRDSEEERRMLEKTCEILIKAFKEEQKIYFEALNMRYEKFLEDCNVRRRRNDIILKSLCRVEDKAKAIYAKTEKLKLLKDRYISYLKQNDFLKNEEPKKRVPCSSTQAVQCDETEVKSVHWKAPDIADIQEYTPQTIPNVHEEISKQLSLMTNTEHASEIISNTDIYHSPVERTSPLSLYPGNIQVTTALSQRQIPESSCRTQENYRIILDTSIILDKTFTDSGTSSVNIAPNTIDPTFSSQSPKNHFTSREENKPKIASDINTYPEFGTNEVSKGECMFQQPESIANVATSPMHHAIRLQENGQIRPEETENVDHVGTVHLFSGAPESHSPHSDTEDESPRGGPIYIKGLDGVDYQNETYPESYYEQPVHSHNYSSLASNVILEEDEYDLDENQADGNEPSAYDSRENPLEVSDFHRQDPPPSSNGSKHNSPLIRPDNRIIGPKGLAADSKDDSDMKFTLEGPNGAGTNSADDSFGLGPEKLKAPGKTNLMQLLESDSESFQIEHGDMISGNDDSDFDFSLAQNQE